MTSDELANELKSMYLNAEKGESVTMIHLFAIKYAKEIKNSGVSMLSIAETANIGGSYGTEISKGVRLAKYVSLK
jgi:hypothetical protein